MKTQLLTLLLVITIGTSLLAVEDSSAYYSSSVIVSGVSLSMGCWAVPTTPTLISPANDYMAIPGSDWIAHPLMDWSDSWVCPDKTVSYQYESYRDSGLSQLAYRSGLLSQSNIPAPGTPDGDYYWRVKAFDGEKWSDWSTVWHFIVDTSIVRDTLAPPTPYLISPGNNTVLNSSDLVQTWTEVTDNSGGEVYYDYEGYHNAQLNGPVVSGTFSNSGDGNGTVITKHSEGQANGQTYWRVRARDEAGNVSAWSTVWHFQINNSKPDPSPEPEPAPPISDIVLNEILPNPSGTDNAAKPDGEWVELYNRSGSSIDVNGWHLTDAGDSHSVVVNGAKTNTGGTVIAAHGWLVVYLGGTAVTLNDHGDTVNLYQGAVAPANLRDSHIYTATGEVPEGKSIARIPDGSATWYDPIPTPGGPNELGPALDLHLSADRKTVSFTLSSIGTFSKFSYELTYNSDSAPQGVVGQELITSQTEYQKEITLGTCSTGGTCTYHTGVSNLHLKVTLQKDDGSEITLEQGL